MLLQKGIKLLLVQLDFQDLQILEDLLSVVDRFDVERFDVERFDVERFDVERFDVGRFAHVVCLGCPDR